jgi:hypothetical protein
VAAVPVVGLVLVWLALQILAAVAVVVQQGIAQELAVAVLLSLHIPALLLLLQVAL